MVTERFNVSLRQVSVLPMPFGWKRRRLCCNLRGGGEYGKNGRNQNAKKQNVFDDFIAAAEYLVKINTLLQYLAIRGGSNGGCL
jgi:hypothetical protein